MQKYGCYFIVYFLLIIITYSANSQDIPSSRRTNWSLAGYNGTIPDYPIIKNITDFGGSGNNTSLNDMALQNAIASLANQNGVIYFPAGIFLFNSSVTLRSGIILRGAGAATTLKFNLSGTGNLVNVAGNTSASVAGIKSPLSKDQSSLRTNNASLFRVNDYLKIYQNDSSLVNDLFALETVGQLVRIENISGDSIYFSNVVRRNYLLADSPKIRRFEMITGVGIECLKIKRMDSAGPLRSNIFFSAAANCWVKGVESDSCNFAHIRIVNSTNIEVTNSYLHGAFSYGATGEGYGISCESTSGECLIENNIFSHLRHSMLLQSGANGNVFDYNYSVAPFKSEAFPNDLSGDIVLHGNYPYLNLFEGNIVQNITVDASHDINGPYNTLFRNRAELYGLGISAGAGDSTNVVGNEINGKGFGQGNYLLQGNGNLEYGNNKNNMIIPPGTVGLTANSYIYNSRPAFWNISSSWPSIGIPATISLGTIPAKERYVTGSELTYCLSVKPVTYTFTGNGNWNTAANWSNNIIPAAVLSDGSEIIINPPTGGRCILNIPFALNPGAKLTVREGKRFVINGNLTLQ